ncbi:hypothetical protein JTB14_002671 [Gonioctena quinquepunctata]|nr:hypothetical protein JTB14_002671 [Gonioctena quinquepunctata]
MTKLSLRMTKVAFLQSQLRRGVIMVKTTTPMMKKWTGQQAIDDNVPNLRAARTTDASTALIRRRLRNPGQSREGHQEVGYPQQGISPTYFTPITQTVIDLTLCSTEPV